MNNKGFTLIELLASIMLLTIIMSVTAGVVINYINTSKEKSYEVLVKNIKIGAQQYFEECDNVTVMNSDINCTNVIKTTNCDGANKCATIKFGDLVKYGFLKGSSKDDSSNKIIENPINNENMNGCIIKVLKYVDSNYSVSYDFKTTSTESYCPTNEEFAK